MLTDARGACLRLRDNIKQTDWLPRQALLAGGVAEALEIAEDSVFHALNVLANHLDDDAAQAEIDGFDYERARR